MSLDDAVARYDPLEAVVEIADATGLDVKTVAAVLEAEFDYLGCLGLLDEGGLDEEGRGELESLKRSNLDLLDASDGQYDHGAAVSFIQRNRGIDKDVIERVVEANYRFMEARGFLDEEWGEG